MDYEQHLLYKIAYYYYFENLTQQHIADMLSISRIKVIRGLELARKTGIIQFKLRETPDFNADIEKALKEQFHLKDVFVVPNPPSEDRTNANVAQAAALYINDRIKPGDYLNIGYGDTARQVLNSLATMAEEPISCVSLTGGVEYYLPDNRSHAFYANLHLIPAPLLASSTEMAEAIRKEESIHQVFQMAPLSCLSVVGIGGMHETSTIFYSGTLNKNEMTYLRMRGAVGDILSHFFDKDGTLIDSVVEERLISTPLHSLKTLPNVVGVAAGKNKVKAIRATLIGEYLDVLITDTNTAKLLLEE
ncbi:MAG: sugar-binding transcriptional regulator [Sphaerochaetaceae bacterium]